MEIPELEKNLIAANAKVTALVQMRAGFSEQRAAFIAQTMAQRELAAAKGEQYAMPYDIGLKAEFPCPRPALFQTEAGAYLIFRAKKINQDGKHQPAGYAVIEFEKCQLTKFGYPNDEALAGHPLYDKGLNLFGIFKVIDSAWIKQLTDQNRASFPKTPESAKSHYFFSFKESTFECIADNLRATLSGTNYQEIITDIMKKSLD